MAKQGIETVPTRWDKVKRHVNHPGGGELITKQSMRDECDINVLLATYKKTGQFPVTNMIDPQYGDFSELPETLADAIAIVEDAKGAFAELPSKVRDAAGNDPLRFVQMANDPVGLEVLLEAGLRPEQIKTAAVTPQSDGD